MEKESLPTERSSFLQNLSLIKSRECQEAGLVDDSRSFTNQRYCVLNAFLDNHSESSEAAPALKNPKDVRKFWCNFSVQRYSQLILCHFAWKFCRLLGNVKPQNEIGPYQWKIHVKRKLTIPPYAWRGHSDTCWNWQVFINSWPSAMSTLQQKVLKI